jgi:hypothetical protein
MCCVGGKERGVRLGSAFCIVSTNMCFVKHTLRVHERNVQSETNIDGLAKKTVSNCMHKVPPRVYGCLRHAIALSSATNR